jgi:hypothetical protein
MKTVNITTEMQQSLKIGLLAPVAAIGLAAAPHARADSILLAQTTLVVGSQSTVDSFTTSGAGTVSVHLANISWPMQLQSLSFAATSASQVLWSGGGAMSNEGATFNVSSGGTYFAHIMATAQGALNIGLYSVLMTFTPSTSPVPLPASGWMLLTGMFVLAGLAWAARPAGLMGAAKA